MGQTAGSHKFPEAMYHSDVPIKQAGRHIFLGQEEIQTVCSRRGGSGGGSDANRGGGTRSSTDQRGWSGKAAMLSHSCKTFASDNTLMLEDFLECAESCNLDVI